MLFCIMTTSTVSPVGTIFSAVLPLQAENVAKENRANMDMQKNNLAKLMNLLDILIVLNGMLIHLLIYLNKLHPENEIGICRDSR